MGGEACYHADHPNCRCVLMPLGSTVWPGTNPLRKTPHLNFIILRTPLQRHDVNMCWYRTKINIHTTEGSHVVTVTVDTPCTMIHTPGLHNTGLSLTPNNASMEITEAAQTCTCKICIQRHPWRYICSSYMICTPLTLSCVLGSAPFSSNTLTVS